MALAPIAGVIAASTAAGAYLNANYHSRKDIETIRSFRNDERNFAEACESKVDQRDARLVVSKSWIDIELTLHDTAKNGRVSLWYWFEAQAKRMPANEEAIWSRMGCYTWAETYANACRYGQWFLQIGVKPGQLVAFYLTNQPEFVFGHLGLWAVGCAPAMINFHLAGDALLHCLKVAGGKLLVVDEDPDVRQRIEQVRDKIEGELGMTIKILDRQMKGMIMGIEPKRPEDELRTSMKGSFPMCLFYTSGTTGNPKACPLPCERSSALAGDRARNLDLHAGPNGARWYVCMPLYHGTGCTTAVSCMLVGLTLCLGKKFSSSNFWSDIRDSDSTAFVYVGETARYLLANPPSPLDKKHRAKTMFGNGMRPDVWHRFVERFGIETVGEFFNSSEGVFATMSASRGPFLATSVGHHGAILRHRFRDIYAAVETDLATDTIVRDPKTGFAKRRPFEVGGEIVVQMPHEKAFVGYWNNPEATAKKFERNLFKKGDLYFRTGDALRRDADGRWFFLDRLGDTFRWKSENVSTAEVGEVLGNYPGVVEANVYGVEVPGHDGRAGCAALFISPSESSTFDLNAFLAYAQAKLPKYAVPVFVRVLNSITVMHNNKQNKVLLRNDGIDMRKMMERMDNETLKNGTDKEKLKYDTMYWNPASLRTEKTSIVTNAFVPYSVEEWDKLRESVSPVARL